MEVYSSFSNIMNFQRSGISASALYKRYALLYDQVIFNRYGCPIGDFPRSSNLSEFIANFAVSDDSINDIQLGKNKKFKEIFVDMWDYFDNPEQAQADALALVRDNDASKISSFAWGRDAIDREMGIHNHDKEYKAAGIIGSDITSDLGFNFLLKDKLESFKINFAPVVGDAVKESYDNEPSNSLFSTELVIPNFENMTWDKILELREDKYIKAFRNKVFSYSSSNQNIDNLLSEDITKDLWVIAGQNRPDVKRTIIDIVLSNIPVPTVINPFSLYLGVNEIKKNISNDNNHSWLYFVQRVKDKI